jgi:hypothetical protein
MSGAFYYYQVHTRPRVQRASGIPQALFWGRETNQWLGRIARRGLKVCLQTMRLFENDFGVGAERGAAIAPQTACVMPGLDLT